MVDHIKDVGYSGVTFSYSMLVDYNTGRVSPPSITNMWTYVDYAYSKGLNVKLKLYWTDRNSQNINQWNTTDIANTAMPLNWFDQANPTVVKPYVTALLNDIDAYATGLVPTANAHHISMIVLGTENDFLTYSQYHSNWVDIVSHVRTAGFTGVLTYDAIYQGLTAENFANVSIWDINGIDKIGLSFYPDFSGTPLADINAAMNTWTYRDKASLQSSCAIINNSVTDPVTSIVTDLTQLKSRFNKEIILTENTYQDSQLAAMNWETVNNLVSCGVTPDATQHTLVLEAQLKQIKTNLHGVVTGFSLSGYDPWEYGQTTGAMAVWKNYDQLTGQAAEAMLKTYLQAGL
jgi:hypothetical protein